jgi:hypothetical protein
MWGRGHDAKLRIKTYTNDFFCKLCDFQKMREHGLLNPYLIPHIRIVSTTTEKLYLKSLERKKRKHFYNTTISYTDYIYII